jgi:hypothetical protein
VPFIEKAFAEMGFAGKGPASTTSITVEIVRKPADQIRVRGIIRPGLALAQD